MSAWKRGFVHLAAGASTLLGPTLVLVMQDISFLLQLTVITHAVVRKLINFDAEA